MHLKESGVLAELIANLPQKPDGYGCPDERPAQSGRVFAGPSPTG
jgi:hypothetical protein